MLIRTIRETLGISSARSPLPAGARDAGSLAVWSARVRRAGKGGEPPLSTADAEAIARSAGAECVLERVSLLDAGSRPREAQALRRHAWRLGRSRGEMVALATRASRDDDEFKTVVADADAARDAGQWAEAEALYRRALGLYEPLAGYRVQYAHMLKEQGLFDRAEVNYRDALAWGAPVPDIGPHLAFVCHHQGYHGRPPDPEGTCEGPLGLAPTVFDIESLAYAIWREASLSVEDLLSLLRHCPTGECVAARLIEDDRFVFRNGLLLQLLSARK